MADTATKEQIAEQGFGITGSLGGQPKRTYYTPDGRVIKALPDIHAYRKGQESGERDANYDKGWLPTMPSTPELYCPHCDRWHPTQEEVDKCGEKKKRFDTKWQKKAAKEVNPDARIEALESELSDIKGMLKQLLER